MSTLRNLISLRKCKVFEVFWTFTMKWFLAARMHLPSKFLKKILVWKIWLKWWWSHKTRTMDEMQLETRNWAKLCKNVLFTTRTLSSSVLKFWICFTAEIAASFDFTHFSLSWILWDLSPCDKCFRSQSYS